MSKEDSLRNRIAERLRLARKMAGLSQSQVAKLLGLHRPSLSEIEAGRRRVAADELSELARIYGVNVEWLACAESGGEDTRDDKLELAARALSGLKEKDLNRLLEILAALRTSGSKGQ